MSRRRSFASWWEEWIFDVESDWRGISRLFLSVFVVTGALGGTVLLLVALGGRHPALAIVPVTIAVSRWVRWTLRSGGPPAA